MRYLSVCSGIEAATQAWHPMGWQPVAFSEIEKFPSAVLAHHYPETPNWGDMTKFKEWPDAAVDVLVGGTPCQSFSVAGLRKGLDDPRGNLALTYLAIAERYRPEWLVWENVPGVLSSDGGRAFGAIIGGMVELGYCPAWRVLDAQYVRTRRFRRAVPQRRRRVFVVAHLGDWRRAAAVLFDAESLRGNPPPCREAGQDPTRGFANGAEKRGYGLDYEANAHGLDEATGPLLKGSPSGGGHSLPAIAHSLRGEGFDASEDGTGRGTPLVPEVCAPLTTYPHADNESQESKLIPTVANPLTARMQKGINTTCDEGQTPIPVAFSCKDYGADSGETAPTLRAMGHDGSHANAGGQVAVAFMASDYANGTFEHCDAARPITTSADRSRAAPLASTGMAVRRLTPVECERLQGFPDDFTRIPWRGKDADKCPDGPRYKALGNSMATNAMAFIGRRIAMMDGIKP